MKEFRSLVGYEYKKIGKRRSTWIALAVLLAWVLFHGFPLGDYYIEGEAVDSYYALTQKERAVLEDMAGTRLDQGFFQGKSHSNAALSQLQESQEAEEGRASAAYWKKYFEIYMPYHYFDQFYAFLKDYLGDIDLQNMEEQGFYAAHAQMLDALYKIERLSPGEIAVHKEEFAKVEKPYAYGNMLGFDKYFSLQGEHGMAIAFVISICLAPLFAGEYTSHMDSLMLSSRFGKNKVIWAKLLTGFTFAALITIVYLGIYLLELGIVYGFGGWDLPVQVCETGFVLSLPVNMLEMLGISIGCAICASCMVAAAAMFCSAKMQTSFAVILVSVVFLYLPDLLIYAVYDNRPWFMFVNSMPVCMMYPRGVAVSRLFSIGSHYFYFFQVIPVVYLLLMAGLGAWTYRSFRKHPA